MTCVMCRKPLIFVRASKRSRSFFRHSKKSECILATHSNESEERKEDSGVRSGGMGDWHSSWSNAVKDEFREVWFEGKPRDAVDLETKTILEFQHSHITQEEFDLRCEPTKKAIWIFDEMRSRIWSYVPFGDYGFKPLYFIEDHFYINTGHPSCQCFSQAPNGELFIHKLPVPISMSVDDRTVYVRVVAPLVSLKDLSKDEWDTSVIEHFLAKPMPRFQERSKEDHPLFFPFSIRPLVQLHTKDSSVFQLIDQYHRQWLVERCLSQPYRLFVEGPAGAGKTTLLMDIAKRWKEKAILIVTFNKANQVSLQQRLRKERITMARATTLDALCRGTYKGKEVTTRFNDRWVVQTFFKRCNPWTKKRGRYGIANILQRVMKRPKRLPMCELHEKDYGWVADKAFQGVAPFHSTFPGMRVNALKNNSFANFEFDLVLVDEFQDLDFQAKQIIMSIGANRGAREFDSKKKVGPSIIFVGDPMQEIYSWESSFSDCRRCKEIADETPFPQIDKTDRSLRLFQSFRSRDLTCAFLRDVFPDYSGTPGIVGKSSVICTDSVAELPPNCLILVRSKKQVCLLLEELKSPKIVQGGKIAEEIEFIRRYGSGKNSNNSPFDEFVLDMDNEKVDELCESLCSSHVTLDALDTSSDCTYVSTIHRAKGFEYPRVAVFQSLLSSLEKGNKVEKNVAYVAMSRHTECLYLVEDPEDGDETESDGESSVQEGYCHHCLKKLITFREYGDWEGRKYHKKCWIEMKRDEFNEFD